MTAIVLRTLNFSVHILERSSPTILQSQAAGIRAGPELHSFIETYVKDFDPDYALTAESFEIVSKNAEVEMTLPPQDPLRLTTWKCVYDMLLRALVREEGLGSAVYQTGKKVEGLERADEKVVVKFRDVESDEVQMLEADLVTAVDGAHSTVRKIVMEDMVQPKYAGYVTWRGRVPEGDVGPKTREAMKKRCVVMKGVDGGYMISWVSTSMIILDDLAYGARYYVPADPAANVGNKYEFVWIWYDPIPTDSTEFNATFTDVDGKEHFTTIPRGKIRSEVWQRVLDRKDAVSNPHFIELLERTKEPFVSAIRDLAGTRSIFYNGKVLLVGDAFALCQPHAGGSTSQAAYQALELKKALKGETTLPDWEQTCLRGAAAELQRSIGAAKFLFGGEIPKFIEKMVAKSEGQ
ncbi:hypothetical protein EK21DRAFT_111611 [Setomelanomma holmii]|uniref:FAD-binding domain-containing protein n=1 Tax=Setomelanomma holmii TaxID=210430 RepID=A0A9P4LMB6_9PLEO|nr:hypothetical protein EK21DRAFT_111611 [Setomelanomma holmii]